MALNEEELQEMFGEFDGPTEVEEVNPLPEDVALALEQLKAAVAAELPEVRDIMQRIHKMLVKDGSSLYLMNDEQVATLYDVILPHAREQITPTAKPKAARKSSPKNELAAFLKDMSKAGGNFSADDF